MANNIFTGGPSGSPINWSDASAWSDGEPTSASVVEQSGAGTMDISAQTIDGLILDSGADLTVSGSLTVTGSGGATFGGANTTINVTNFVLVESGVTAASGQVNVSGGFDYQGSNANLTVSVANGAEFIEDGQHDTEVITVNGTLSDPNNALSVLGSHDTGQITVDSGFAQEEGSNNAFDVTVNGGIYVDDGTDNSGVVHLAGGSFENEGVGGTATIDMSGGGTLLESGQVGGEVTHLGAGGLVQVTDPTSTGTGDADASHAVINGDVVTFDFTNGDQINLTFDSTANLDIKVDPNGVQFDVTATVCFVTGARIRTVRGEVPVEQLTVGDLAVTASGEARPIVWIGQRTVRSPVPAQWPVRVRAGAFGPGAPNRDLMLSPGHAVCVNAVGEVFIPIDHLINGATIAPVEVDEVTYWHVELESHDVLLAEGLGCESYMDSGNRAFFGHEYGRLDRIDPERNQASLAAYARPFVDDGPIVAFVLSRLVERAKVLGWAENGDPDIHLRVDGRRVEPQAGAGSVRFRLAASEKNVELRSRVFVPAQVGMGGDSRTLGLALLGLRIGEHNISLDDPLIADQFHAEERNDGAGWRWTDGRLVLPPELWAGQTGAVELAIDFIADAFRGWRAPGSLKLPAVA